MVASMTIATLSAILIAIAALSITRDLTRPLDHWWERFL